MGVPRSGTTLLYALLNQHPQIALMYEADLLLLWPLFLKRRSKSQWLKRWNFWRGALERHQLDISRIPSDVTDTRTAIETVCREYAHQKGATIWGDKIANYYGGLSLLRLQFPNARFVVIWRDPADVCRSVIRAGFRSPLLGKRGMAHRALMGCFQLRIERDRLSQRGIHVHEILYEDLVRRPTEEMMKVCRFLGIPFDGKMSTLLAADRSALTPYKHNVLVYGDTIVSSRDQPEVLPADLKRKIERYEVFWRAKHGDWPIFRCAQKSHVRKLLLLERLYDHLLYRLLQGWDLTVVFIYCFAPLQLLKAYRAFKAGIPYFSTWEDYVRALSQRYADQIALRSGEAGTGVRPQQKHSAW